MNTKHFSCYPLQTPVSIGASVLHWFTTCCLLCLHFATVAQPLQTIVQAGHTNNISALIMVPGTSTLISGGIDGRIVWWNYDLGIQSGSMQSHTTKISCMALSHNQQKLAIGGYDKTVVLLDANTGALLQRWVPFDFATTAISFSPNGQWLAATSADRSLWLLNLASGAIVRQKAEDDLYCLAFSPDSKLLYTGCRNGAIYQIAVQSNIAATTWKTLVQTDEQITDLALSPSGKLMAYGTSGHYQNDTAVHGILGVLEISTAQHLVQQHDFPMEIGGRPQSMAWLQNDSLLYVDKAGSLAKLGGTNWQKTTLSFSKVGRFVVNDKSPVSMALPQENTIGIYTRFATIASRNLQSPLAIPQAVQLMQSGNLLVEYANGFKTWDLQLGRMKTAEDKIKPAPQPGFAISHNGRLMVKNTRYGIVITDNEASETQNENRPGLPETEEPIRAVFSPNDKYLALLFASNNLYILDVANQFEIKVSLQLSLSNFAALESPQMVFSPDENLLALADKNILLFNMSQEKVHTLDARRNALYGQLALTFSADSKQLISASHAIYSEATLPEDTTDMEVILVAQGMDDGNPFYLIQEPGRINIWNTATGEKEKTQVLPFREGQFTDATALHATPDGKWLYIGTADQRILRVSYPNFQLENSTYDHNDMVTFVALIPKSNVLVSASPDGTIKLRSPETLLPTATLFALQNDGYLILDSANYYKRSRSGAQAILFKQGEQFFQPEQYDLFFNQPQRVLKSIGIADTLLIAAHQELYDKQRTISGYEAAAPLPNQLIALTITNAQSIAPVTNQKNLSLQLSIASKSMPAASLQVFVNGIPILNGSRGKALQATANSTLQTQVDILLARGSNLISVKAMDGNGVSSFEQKLTIQYKPDEIVRPNLYVVIVSVSNYKDTNLNLQYAVKDGEDFRNIWKNNGKKTLGFASQFGNIYDYTFLNNNATAENIKSIKDTLKNAREEDMVILYFSGHGMLDSQKDFYYATYNIDALQPEKNGLAYRDIESILDNIPPRRKLLLIDACHSGAIDKSSLKEAAVGSNGAIAGARSSIKKYKYNNSGAAQLLGNRFEQMQEMFNNFNKGTGTVVIAAAAGDSYALESDKWNNGVFTYALIQGLKSKAADADKDGNITIAELSSYVAKQVEFLTAGQQKPSERQENAENNFRIW